MANDEKTERDILHEIISKSEEEFEKKLTYISAGALLLSVTLIEKVIKLDCSENLWIIITAWILLILTLLINLFSHLISKIYLRKTIDEIDNSVGIDLRIKYYRKRMISIESLNWIASIFLVLGIGFLILFTSVNAVHPCNKDINKENQKTIIIQNH
jgi:hypothetical protein